MSRLSKEIQSVRERYLPRIGVVALVAVITVIGAHFLIGAHAATPYVAGAAASGTLTGEANTTTDTSNSGASAVQFGSSSTGSNAPMELLNRLSSVKVYPASAAASNGNYYDGWQPGNTGTVSYDLSAVPAANRGQVLFAWSSALDNGSSPDVWVNGGGGAGVSNLPVDYTIEVNAAAGGGSGPPTTGWVTEATVTNNIFLGRQNVINMINPATGTPYNWIEMNITNSSGIDINIDLADATHGVTDDFMFIGDSITTFWAGHYFDSDGTSDGSGDDVADLVNQALGNNYHIVTENAGVSGTTAAEWTQADTSYNSQTSIANALASFPGQYVTLNLGTNDAWGGGGDAGAYYTNMQTLANDVIAAGKTPVIPDISWANNGDGTAWDLGVQAFNSQLSALIASNPKIKAGPNMYSVLKDHTSWFLAAGNVHPDAAGVVAYRCAWAYDIAEKIYGITPTPISSCSQYVSP